MNKLIYNFNSKALKKLKDPKNILGGKGANLSEMGRIGFQYLQALQFQQMSVNYFIKIKRNLNSKIDNKIKSEVKKIEKV